MAKRAARAAQTGFDIGGHGGNGASHCPDCGAPEGERHADGCPLAVTDAGAVDAEAGGAVLSAAALTEQRNEQYPPVHGLNARLSWSSDAVGTWFFLMDGEQALPLGVYGPDRRAERDRILTVLQRAAEGGANTRGD